MTISPKSPVILACRVLFLILMLRSRPTFAVSRAPCLHFFDDRNSCRRLSMSRAWPVFGSRNRQNVQPFV